MPLTGFDPLTPLRSQATLDLPLRAGDQRAFRDLSHREHTTQIALVEERSQQIQVRRR
jgi:hypothetical protein